MYLNGNINHKFINMKQDHHIYLQPCCQYYTLLKILATMGKIMPLRPVVARDKESLINSFSFVYSLPSHFAEVTEENRERLEGLTRELGSDSGDLGVDFQDKLYQVKRVIFNGLLESINSEVTRRVRRKEGENEQDLILKKKNIPKNTAWIVIFG